MSRDDCTFCRIVRGDADAAIVYQDERVCAFLDIDPISPGHTLVVPSAHVVELADLAPETAHAILDVTVAVSRALKALYAPDGISIMQNGGLFNDVGHCHMHVFCRFQGDGFGWRFPGGAAIEPLDAVGARLRGHLTSSLLGA